MNQKNCTKKLHCIFYKPFIVFFFIEYSFILLIPCALKKWPTNQRIDNPYTFLYQKPSIYSHFYYFFSLFHSATKPSSDYRVSSDVKFDLKFRKKLKIFIILIFIFFKTMKKKLNSIFFIFNRKIKSILRFIIFVSMKNSLRKSFIKNMISINFIQFLKQIRMKSERWNKTW